MTKIEWTDCTWNPVRGCQIVSPGCTHCYAMRQAHRFSGRGQPYEELTKMSKSGPIWSGKVRLVPEVLDAPLHWRKPRRIFVNSMSDLFHEDVPDEFIDRVFAVMMLADWHRYQILTKRHERMRDYFDVQTEQRVYQSAVEIALGRGENPNAPNWDIWWEWPAPWIWLGVSCEDQKTADARIPLLLQTPAAVRFVSAEPLLGPIDLRQWLDSSTCDHPRRTCGEVGCKGRTVPNWVIVGGESGPRARPCDVAWIRSIKDRCRAANVACFVKQLGANIRDRNDAGFDAYSETWTEGPRTGQPTNPSAWPEPFHEVDHSPNGYREQYQGAPVRVRLRDRKGCDPQEWPEDIRIRQFPGTSSDPRKLDPGPC